MKKTVLVLDASAMINLLGCGSPERILSALGQESALEESTLKEVIRNPINSEPARPYVDKLVSAGLIRITRMNDESYSHYIDLVSGEPKEALGRGESAAIAYAVEVSGVVILDDVKARRVGKARFPACVQLTSAALFRLAAERAQLTNREIVGLLDFARENARMHFLEDDQKWVDSLKD